MKSIDMLEKDKASRERKLKKLEKKNNLIGIDINISPADFKVISEKVDEMERELDHVLINNDGSLALEIVDKVKKCEFDYVSYKKQVDYCDKVNEIKKIKDDIDELNTGIEYLKWKKLKDNLNRYYKYQEWFNMKNELIDLEKEYELFVENDKKIAEFNSINDKINKIKLRNRLRELEKLVESYNDNKTKIELCDNLDIELRDNNIKLNEITFQLIEGEKLNLRIKNYKERKRELNDLEKRLEQLKIYGKIVSASGIPLQLMKEKIKNIESTVNIFLADFVDYTIEMIPDFSMKIPKLGIIAKKNNVSLVTQDLSGYETFILNIALKMALSKHNYISKCSLLVIDEGLDCIDHENFKKLGLLFKKLRTCYEKIIVITHIAEIRQFEDSNIKIKYSNEYSYISV